MRVSRWWHNFHFLVCIIKLLMCIIDRLLQYTIIFYFSLSFLLSLSLSLSLYPLIKLCLWFFPSFSTAPVSSSSLQKCICPSPSLISLRRDRKPPWIHLFYQNNFQKMRLLHLRTIYVDKTRSARRAFCVFDGLDFSCSRRHAALCC